MASLFGASPLAAEDFPAAEVASRPVAVAFPAVEADSPAAVHPEIFKKEECALNGFVLKIIAMGLMLIDHIGIAFFSPGGLTFRFVGRMAFPIFAYLLVEGFHYTQKSGRTIAYLKRLFLFAILSEIPFNLLETGEWIDFKHQNVFFTLAIALLMLWSVEKSLAKKKEYIALAVVLASVVLVHYLHTDYAERGLLLILLFYLLREKTWGVPVAVLCFCSFALLPKSLYWNPAFYWMQFKTFSWIHLGSLLTIPFLMSYNGKRGYNSTFMKWFFYAFYPIHILCIVLLKAFL